MRRLKVLLVSEDIPGAAMGGLAKHVLTLAKALAEAGHVVDLMGNDQSKMGDVVRTLALPGDFFGELSGAHLGWKEQKLGCFMPPRRALTARRFARAISRRAGNYDVVHYHGHVPDVAAFVPEHVNFVQTRHDQGADCVVHTRFKNGAVCNETQPTACASCIRSQPNALQQWISATAVSQYRRRVAHGMRRHKTIFVSDMLRRNLTRTFGGRGADWGQVVHNFIDWQTIQLHTHTAPPRTQPDSVNILVASKLYPPKGVGEFLLAFAPYQPAHMRVVVAGDGPDEMALRAKYASSLIEFLGWCDYATVLARTATVDAIVVPSTWEEPCATTVLEGLALGRQVFALQRGGTPELSRYEAYPGQLRLFPNLADLSAELSVFQPTGSGTTLAGPTSDVWLRLPELIAVYEHRRLTT